MARQSNLGSNRARASTRPPVRSLDQVNKRPNSTQSHQPPCPHRVRERLEQIRCSPRPMAIYANSLWIPGHHDPSQGHDPAAQVAISVRFKSHGQAISISIGCRSLAQCGDLPGILLNRLDLRDSGSVALRPLYGMRRSAAPTRSSRPAFSLFDQIHLELP